MKQRTEIFFVADGEGSGGVDVSTDVEKSTAQCVGVVTVAKTGVPGQTAGPAQAWRNRMLIVQCIARVDFIDHNPLYFLSPLGNSAL